MYAPLTTVSYNCFQPITKVSNFNFNTRVVAYSVYLPCYATHHKVNNYRLAYNNNNNINFQHLLTETLIQSQCSHNMIISRFFHSLSPSLSLFSATPVALLILFHLFVECVSIICYFVILLFFASDFSYFATVCWPVCASDIENAFCFAIIVFHCSH